MSLDLESTNEVDNSLKGGVQTVVIIPPFKENRVDIVNKFVSKAVNEGVKNVILIGPLGTTSGEKKYHQDYMAMESHIQGIGNLNWTFFRFAIFEEDINFQSSLIKSGTLNLPIGTSKISPICVCDVAEVVSKAVVNPSMVSNKAYNITGPESLSGTEMAKIFSDKLGRSVNFVSSSVNEWKDQMRKLGLKNEYKIESLAELYDWYAKGHGSRVHTQEYETLVGTKPSTFAHFVEANKQLFV